MAGDAGVAGADATSCLDTRRMFEHLRRSSGQDGDDPIINIYGVGNRNGLGVQSFWSRGYDFKPQPEDTFVRYYGPHRYFERGSNTLRWPWWRRPVELYKWSRTASGLLHDVHHFYMWCDGTTPMALLHRIHLTMLLRNPWDDTYTDRSLTERIHHFIAPYVRQPPPPRRRPPVVLVDEGGVSDASTDSDPPPPTSSRPVPLDWRPMSPEPAPPVPAATVPPPPARTVVEMPVWGPTQDFKNAWETVFRPGDRCTYCASDSHIFSTRDGRPICPRYHAGEIYTCQYKYCNTDVLHCTKMCPVLHAVCSTCYTRGHSEEQRCEEWGEEEWTDRRDNWEAVADLGLHTAARHRIWNQGFYYHRRFTAWPWPFESYTHLTTVPVLRVLAILRDWARGIAPLPPTRARPAFHEEPRPRSRKRPAPTESQYHAGPTLPPVARARALDFFQGRLQPTPLHPPGSSLAAAAERRPKESPDKELPDQPPKKRLQAVVRRIPRGEPREPDPPAPRLHRGPTATIIRPLVPRSHSLPSRPDLSRPPPSSAAASSAETATPMVGVRRVFVLPPVQVPPPALPAPAQQRRPQLLELPPSPPRPSRARAQSSTSSEAVDLHVRPEDRLE